MQEYDVRRGHSSNIEGGQLESLIREIFGSVNVEADGWLVTSFGGLEQLKVLQKDKTTLIVDTKMNSKVDGNVASETIQKYNDFLLKATGFSSKERSKRIQKKAKKGK